MSVEIKVPAVGESITEVQLGEWLKAEGDDVEQDEPLIELESEKATFDLPAPASGVMTKIVKQAGDTAEIGEVIAYIEEAAERPRKEPARERKPAREERAEAERPARRAKPAAREAAVETAEARPRVMPAADRLLREHGLGPEEVEATGPSGRLLKEDVLRHVEREKPEPRKPEAEPTRPVREAPPLPETDREEEAVPMSPIRRRIAQRLVEAQQTAALLTTFNEIDMSAVVELRRQHRDAYQEKYGIRLGFMSFFVKASIEALKQFPQVNPEIRGSQIVYRNYYDIGIAVAGGKGLVVPVLRNAERMSFAEIEQTIADFGRRARENRLEIEELQGGTFTISNGGVYGSLLSTPIVNPPQSGVLGMHAIQDRPVVRDGQIVVRPMMYVALTYDHRIVDGREAVTFLRRIKEAVEEPTRILLEI
jgi:2-oxoglutarate dehydrogenase E2 component (dihydrolipoamide succinyltransferase)